MKLTNKNNYPIAFYNAVLDSLYKPKEDIIRVTELISPPLIRHLRIKHWDDIVIDVDDSLLALYGTALHNFLLAYEPKDGVLFKQRFDIKLSTDGITDNFVLSGEPDKFTVKSGLLEDYKFTSVWSFVYGKDEWIKQLNLYAYLLHNHGYDVNKLQINAQFRDWSYYQSIKKGNEDYPKMRGISKKIKLWSLDEAEQYINDQAIDHRLDYKRECTADERWERPTTYAVMKEGRKSALRVLNSEDAAIYWCGSKGHNVGSKGIYIDKRIGGRIRCQEYCNVNKFCPYYEPTS